MSSRGHAKIVDEFVTDAHHEQRVRRVGAVQAFRLAQRRLLVNAVHRPRQAEAVLQRDPFSRGRSRPIAQDLVASFIDVEQLPYCVWLNAEKNPAHRKSTLYLFFAEGVDETLRIRSDLQTAPPGFASARPADVRATLA